MTGKNLWEKFGGNLKIKKMYLKRIDKLGNKYYINAFTGVTVQIPTANPLKREPDMTLQKLMSQRSSLGFHQGTNAQLFANQKTVFIGDFKKLMKLKPEKRDKKEFIKACKRVNINPWPLFDITYNQYYNLIDLK